MKANELMIGDWVRKLESCGHTIPVRVTGIIDEDSSVLFERRDCVHGVTDIKAFEPIPLTAEILEKNGFEQDDYYLQFTLYLDSKRAKSRSVVMLPQDEEWSEIDMTLRCNKADVTMELCYVHELQHALRLCGIDKEIEL